MKRIVAAFLALILLLSLLPLAGAAFTDAGLIAETYSAAVNDVAEKGVISGFPDGSFQPKGTLTRAQAAKILCVLLEGAEKADALTKTDTSFSDVPATHWAAKYVAYCAEKGIVAGVGGGKFDPDGKLSGAAFAKMLLVAYGADGAKFTGAEWMANVQAALPDAFLDNKLENFDARALPRQEAAQMAWNALYKAAADDAASKDMDSRPLPAGIPESIKIFAIGNSFSNDSVLGYLFEMLHDVGVKNVTVGNIYYSGCSLQTHVKYAMNGTATYTYYKKSVPGDWIKKEKVTIDEALLDEDWDVISFQQTPTPPYQPAKNVLMHYVQLRRPNANFVWNQIWAHSARSKQKSFRNEKYGGDQMKMYTLMTQDVVQNVLTDPRIRFVAPVGTAIQNARTSFLGDNLDRDTYHLNRGIGRYIASMVWCCRLTGCTPDQIGYVPAKLLDTPPAGFEKTTPGLSDALVKVAKESVTNALAKPYEITQSKLTTFP